MRAAGIASVTACAGSPGAGPIKPLDVRDPLIAILLFCCGMRSHCWEPIETALGKQAQFHGSTPVAALGVVKPAGG